MFTIFCSPKVFKCSISVLQAFRFNRDFRSLVTQERWLPLPKRILAFVAFVTSSLVTTAVAVWRSTVPFFRNVTVVIASKLSDLSFATEVVLIPRFCAARSQMDWWWHLLQWRHVFVVWHSLLRCPTFRQIKHRHFRWRISFRFAGSMTFWQDPE